MRIAPTVAPPLPAAKKGAEGFSLRHGEIGNISKRHRVAKEPHLVPKFNLGTRCRKRGICHEIHKISLTIFSIPLLISAGCTDQTQLNELRKQVKELKDQVENIDKNTFKHALKLYQIKEGRQYIKLDISSKSYQKIDSDGLIFFICCNSVKPYTGGYKIVLLIGNPYVILFNGFELSIEWGRNYDSNKDKYDEWKKSLKNKKESFTNLLLPGQWNKIELIIFPAKEDEIQYLKVGPLETNKLQFPPPLLFHSSK